MADVKKIAVANLDAASDTSLTSAFPVDGSFSHYFVAVPAGSGWCITTTCGIHVQGASHSSGSFYDVAFSNNPATTSSGHAIWSTAGSASVSGAMIICEALQFVPGWAKLRFLNTATANTDFVVYGRKFD